MCTFYFSSTLMIVVCTVNAIQCLVIFYTLYIHYRRRDAFLVLGDAIASFTSDPEELTRYAGILSAQNFSGKGRSWPLEGPKPSNVAVVRQSQNDGRWYHAPGTKNYTLVICL